MQPPALRIENEREPEALAQYFQVTVNVLEARKLAWSNQYVASSYVIVSLGKKKRRTGIRKNMKEPYYREHFVFELYLSLRELHKTSLSLEVIEVRRCITPRLIGEANIDLGSVWAQPLHQVFHKWAQLGLPSEWSAGATGFLKVDLSITNQCDIQTLPTSVNEDKIENNMLLPREFAQQRANYLITIYGAYGLTAGVASKGDGRYGKPLSTFVRLSFCGLVAKTAVQPRSNNPNYCEQISIVELFPNICETIHMELCSGEGCLIKVLASTQLKLSEISHDDEIGFLPTFGPSLLHIYGTTPVGFSNASDIDGPYYKGALLSALNTIVPYYNEEIRTVTVEPVTNILPESLWVIDNFCVLCPILEVSMIDRNVAGKFCGVAITMGEFLNNDTKDEEFLAMMKEIRSRKLHYTGSLEVQKTKPVYGYLDLSDSYPVLQLAVQLPDFRFRIYKNNMIYGIIADLVFTVSDIETRLINQEYNTPKELIDDLNKAVDDAAGNIQRFLDILKYCCIADGSDDMMRNCCTELDKRQLNLQKDVIEKLYRKMSRRKFSTSKPFETNDITSNSSAKKDIKIMIAEVKTFIERLNKITFKSYNGWPDIVVWLLNGGSRVAYTKISTADIIYSTIPEQSGRLCGKLQSIYMQPLKCLEHTSISTNGCTCIAAKVELMMWMSLYREMGAFENHVMPGHQLGIKDYEIYIKSSRSLMLECRIYVYKAKLNTSANYSSPIHAFVRVNILNSVQDTTTTQKNATNHQPSRLVWNQTLKICTIVNTTVERLNEDPPSALIEVYNKNTLNKIELIGRFQMQPVVRDTQIYNYAPKLQWYEFNKGENQMGQLLMSAQLIVIPETVSNATIYNIEEKTYYVSSVNNSDLSSQGIHHLPNCILPKSNKYKLDIYWWGLRDLIIPNKPSVIIDLDDLTIKSETINNKSKNCNFMNSQMSQNFEAALFETHCTSMTIRLYDSSTFGRTVVLGTKIVRDPKKFLIDCIPRTAREISLKTSNVVSAEFYQVTQMLYVKKTQSPSFSADLISVKSEKPYNTAKKFKWKNLFKKTLDEEEYTLLPVPRKGGDPDVKRFGPDMIDWWYIFNASQKDGDCEDKFGPTNKITIYNEELESQPKFSHFKDWCSTLKFYSGKKTGVPQQDKTLYCGCLKVGIAIYEWPPSDNFDVVGLNGVDLNKGYFSDYPSNDIRKFLVRVYIIKGIDLKTKNFTGKCHPYVIISCGDKHLGDRSEYIANSTNPLFGRMYEFRCTLPYNYLFTVSVYDCGPEDELIGSTNIDIENRVYTKHRALVGLPLRYKTTGPNKWRDIFKPSEILEDLCQKNHLPLPQYPDLNTVVLNGVEYKDNEKASFLCTPKDRIENICLNLLHNWQTMLMCGHYLVPQHVETRSLYNSDKLGVKQGKIQMWVDIFPMDTCFIPPPVDISPPKDQDYELRVIVWNVVNLGIDRRDWKDDIYVKAWFGSMDDAQYTHIRYRNETGRGSFNWRMAFQFQYNSTERKLIRKEKGPFTEIVEHLEPVFIVHVLDNETGLTPLDDVIASLALNLNSMSRGFKNASQCNLEAMMNSIKIDLFILRSVRAWWPLKYTNRNTDYSRYTGSIELEFTLLPLEKALLMPVGMEKDPPAPFPFPELQSHSQCCKTRLLENICRYGGVEVLIVVFIMAVLLTAICYWRLPILVYKLLVEE